jgi:hypothetical protein
MKKLPEQCSCCEQKCAKTGCAEFPTRWCKKRKTKCARSERCKEYEYKYYDSPRCAEWATKVVQGESCLQWQHVLYNTGVCKRYENKYVSCARESVCRLANERGSLRSLGRFAEYFSCETPRFPRLR